MMTDAELDELQDPASWDEGEIRPPVKAPRAVVSVGFSREEFDRVSERARANGMKTSEFIRYAALEKSVGAAIRVERVSGRIQTSVPRASVGTTTARFRIVNKIEDIAAAW